MIDSRGLDFVVGRDGGNGLGHVLVCTVCQDVGLTKGPDVRGLSPMSLFYYWRAVR